MKKFSLLFSISIICFISVLQAQDSSSAKKNYFKFQTRLKLGAGQTITALPILFNDVLIHSATSATPVSGLKNDFLKTNWGPYTGGNFDFYFHPNVGFGIDLDYFNNKVKFISPQILKDFVDVHPETNLVESNRKNQHFVFLGIGPSFKLFTNEKWDVDLNIRAGLSHLQMGSLSISVDSVLLPNSPGYAYRKSILIYDYNKSINTVGIKTGLYVNYWFNSFVGISLGADFIHSFLFTDKIRSDASYILQYKDPRNFVNSQGQLNEFSYFLGSATLDDYPVKSFNVNHVSVSAGVVFRVKKISDVPSKEKTKDIIVTVKDSLTGVIEPEVDINLRNNNGLIIQTGRTGSNGKYVFKDVPPGEYSLDGKKDQSLTNKAVVTRSEFSKMGKSINKELLLNNRKFILAGVTVECDNKDKVVSGVKIELTNRLTGKVEKAVSGEDGSFTFKLEPNTDYSIIGKRDSFYSSVQEVTTKGLNRSKTMYVKLKLCIEHLGVGTTFVLKNIYYDFDKCDIRKDAAIELDRLVNDILKKYPSITIELSSHTDQRGSDSYNDKLSQCRAESAVNYIVSKGISKSRITAVGKGKHALLQDCSKEEGCPQTSEGDCPCHQNNRRTEVKILKM